MTEIFYYTSLTPLSHPATRWPRKLGETVSGSLASSARQSPEAPRKLGTEGGRRLASSAGAHMAATWQNVGAMCSAHGVDAPLSHSL